MEVRDPATGKVRHSVAAAVAGDRSALVVLHRRGLAAYTLTDGHQLALVVARMENLQEVRRIRLEDLTLVEVSQDERWLLVDAPRLQLRDVNTLAVVGSMRKEVMDSLVAVFAPDSRSVVVGTGRFTWLLDVPSLKQRWRAPVGFSKARFTRTAVIFPDQRVALGLRNGREAAWNAPPDCSGSLSPDGKRVAWVEEGHVKVDSVTRHCGR